MPCVTKGVKDQAGFLRRLLLDGHNCQRQYILVFQQPSSFLWESFSGVEDTNSFLFLSQEWHKTCRKGFTDEVLKLRRSNIHFYPFRRQHHCSKKKKVLWMQYWIYCSGHHRRRRAVYSFTSHICNNIRKKGEQISQNRGNVEYSSISGL